MLMTSSDAQVFFLSPDNINNFLVECMLIIKWNIDMDLSYAFDPVNHIVGSSHTYTASMIASDFILNGRSAII